jgi:drug/metabolite transporter (DMT)-like permease
MKKFAFVIVACFLWAIQNAALEIKLSKYSALGNMLVTYFTALPLALITLLYLRFSGTAVTIMPTGEGLAWAIGCALLFFIADFLYIGAYTLGGNSNSISILTLTIPVFVIGIKFWWKGEVPSGNHVLAFICALATFFFIYRAESGKKETVPQEATVRVNE